MCLAVPGKVIEITSSDNLLDLKGKISFAGIIKEVCLAYVPEVKINDYVIVHAGFALSIIDEQEAKQTLDDLATIKNFDEGVAK
ncbi:HypC/HybG/HupF family hydrogenase formation chaperone [Cyanobacterium aponinum UTEX 3222]|uniref:HypC/HybG/HupF family hydrogenase formation chaperone n=1 Tax=Cyanobacterium aponinum TaxID=379064 RepID=UPI000C12B142|nr:HypC/HybG/HupF family hydrogenase formation chaperone [Cyanobacterium aponinum]PHV63985.1 HypC/HybG/HupF family hydrogenase formation chaperone [Cyanobacterium aponinum IPPAS B-1201]WRL42419.1 HypC/HybG/HupF family hydrogenase formation chaperone [Cyanobacterium aponinum UTEX 3222]